MAAAAMRLRAMTFNVRYDEPRDGAHVWACRRGAALDTIIRHAPDLVALQEPTPDQWRDIASALPDYSPFGRDAADWSDAERPAGFFLTRRFAVEDRGTFWLSDTPSIPDSESWSHDWGPRACTWVRLRDRRVARELVFASTHFDTNAAAWLPSASVVRAELDSVARGAAIVLAGDVNCPAGSDAHRRFCGDGGFRDTWIEAGCSDDRVVTFNGFSSVTCLPEEPDASYPAEAFACGNYRIDWILVRGALACVEAQIDRGTGGALVSDHFPVIATLDWMA